MKLGHFYTILGYETTPAPENFFYSHSFCLIYGEPVTETGLLAEKKFGNFKIQAGVTRGWDNWEDNNNDLSFMGGVSWTDDDERSSLAFTMQSGPEQNEPPQNVNFRNIFSLVYQQKFGERFQYVIQYDYGYEERSDVYHLPPAEWIGLNQYLFYTINEQWKAGVRFEWFRDRDGVRLAARPARSRLLRTHGRVELDAHTPASSCGPNSATIGSARRTTRPIAMPASRTNCCWIAT